jgi:5-methyltetrahydrofolate--homocysteine methyltransferase
MLGQADLDVIAQEAAAQVRAGADVLEVCVSGAGRDETTYLPQVVKAVARSVTVPLCICAKAPEALDAALANCPGKPVAYLVDQQTGPWQDFLAVAARRGAAVIAQGLEPHGVPEGLDERIEVTRRVLREAIAAGVAREDVIVDPVVLPVAEYEGAAAQALRLIAHVAQIDAINMTVRVGSLSSGLPANGDLDHLFMARAVAAGVTCLMVDDVAAARGFALMSDVLLGREGALSRYRDFARETHGAATAQLAF